MSLSISSACFFWVDCLYFLCRAGTLTHMISLQQVYDTNQLFRVNQTYNLLTTVVRDTKDFASNVTCNKVVPSKSGSERDFLK